MNRRSFVSRWPFRGHCEDIVRSSERRRDERTGAHEIAARKIVFHLHLTIALAALPLLRHAARSPCRTPSPPTAAAATREHSSRTPGNSSPGRGRTSQGVIY